MEKPDVEREIVVGWENRILEIARTQIEVIEVQPDENPEEKSGKNEHFPFTLLKDAKLYFLKAIELQRSRLSKFWHTESTKDIVGVLAFVFGYGILGYSVLLTFFDKWVFGYETGLHVFGVGAGIYLFFDIFKYVVDISRGRK